MSTTHSARSRRTRVVAWQEVKVVVLRPRITARGAGKGGEGEGGGAAGGTRTPSGSRAPMGPCAPHRALPRHPQHSGRCRMVPPPPPSSRAPGCVMRRHAPIATRTPSGYAPKEDDDADALGSALGAATAGAFAVGLPPSRRSSMLDILAMGGEEGVREGCAGDKSDKDSDLAGLKSDVQ